MKFKAYKIIVMKSFSSLWTDSAQSLIDTFWTLTLWRRRNFIVTTFNFFWLVFFINFPSLLVSHFSRLSIHVFPFHLLFFLIHLLFIIFLLFIILIILILINLFFTWNSVSFNVFPHLIQQLLFVFIFTTDWNSAWKVKKNWGGDGTQRFIIEWYQSQFLLKLSNMFQKKVP